ncbi:MAG: M6 family metalloprotease domain-containing protein [Bacteroidaceae bacterium]|nr:M6 family metalloprotease domain-containing protein [Bacteroidaceae bacterium]
MRRLEVFLMIVWIMLSSMGQSVVGESTSGLPRGCRREQMLRRHGTKKTRRASGVTRKVDKYVGTRHQLVVLVSFADLKFLEEDPLPLWNRIFNEVGYHEDGYVGSVHDYFYDQSYHQWNLMFDLQYIGLDESRVKYKSYYGDPYDENSKYLIYDIVDVLLKRNIDWSLYDWDEDGEIDQLLVVYAGKGMNIDGDNNTIWPHQWWLSEHDNCQPRTVSSGGKNYLIDTYCVVMETANSSGVYTAFGTLCHEYSHCLGLPDFYNGSTSIVRDWDIMDYGCYNGQSFCPCNYSAHERMFMGWLTPNELQTKTSVTNIPSLDKAPVAYLVRNDGWADEYYILENRQQQGWDAYLPGSGLIVFHVDYDEQLWIIGTPNSDSNKPRYRIIPANNKTSTTSMSMKGWGYPYVGGDDINNALTNNTLPVAKVNHKNIDGSYYMSKPITNISVTDGLACFDFFADETGIKSLSSSVSQGKEDIFNISGQRLSFPVKGINIIGGQKVLIR